MNAQVVGGPIHNSASPAAGRGGNNWGGQTGVKVIVRSVEVEKESMRYEEMENAPKGTETDFIARRYYVCFWIFCICIQRYWL
jgi:hypothetical protein